MRLHDRYLLRELLTPLAFCLGGFLVLGISVIFKEEIGIIQERKLNALETVAFCATSLPEFFLGILPILLLLALLYALTHHARYNEITALRAAGVSLWRLCAPYFAIGLLASVVYLGTNEMVVPACARWAEAILNRHVLPADRDKAGRGLKQFSNAQAHRLWTCTDYDARTTQMQNPTVTWTLPDGSWHELRALRAAHVNGVWTFYEVQPQVSFSGAQQDAVRLPSTNVLAMPAFDETPDHVRLLMKFANSQTLRSTGNADIPLVELWEYLRTNPGLSPEDARALKTKFYGRLATPWTCLVVVLIAIPFGAPSGRRNLFFGVAGSIFIGFAFFVLQKVSLALGVNGQLPAWLAAWLPNLIFATAGVVLTLRVR
jgi:lipopolysaccharide export system permease protein